ncbi:hypothetical protein [Singulisphaera sp. GP187]|uniref:hypothetical protein n=1 Tax=Singulisphaera sp. GP187 TaxID=1882752 RepID=UPI0011611621|nr:hypothetical protein [Singulisphaera sp. GP187]
MVRLKRFSLIGASLLGLGLVSIGFSGGCSSDSEPPVQTEAQKEAEKKAVQEQNEANDSASKAARRGNR